MQNKVIKKVLMCQPLHFASLNYSINPWMHPGTINSTQAMKQWNDLVTLYKAIGIEVSIIDQQADVPDMVFATDQGIVEGHTVLLSRFWHQERRGESKYYKQWFKKQGYSVQSLPDNIYFEGNGDALFWKNKLFIGVGYRADTATCRTISRLIKADIVPLMINHPAFYHLDVAFFPLNNETAFYYPEAFSYESRQVLRKEVPNLIAFTKEEADGFCANSIVTDHHVIHQKGNPTFVKKLKQLGYTSIEVDLGEFKKSGGGAHCLTNILETAIN